MQNKKTVIILLISFFLLGINSLNALAEQISGVAYTQASLSNLRTDREGDAEIVQKLPINTEVDILDKLDGWYFIQVPSKDLVQGWIYQGLLADRPLTLNEAIKQYDHTPESSITRLKWIERAAALAPNNHEVLHELVQTLKYHQKFDRADQASQRIAELKEKSGKAERNYSDIYIKNKSSYSSNETCQIWPSYLGEDRSKCNCFDDLKNLEITLPEKTTLMSVCLRDWNKGEPIDLRTTKITLDQYENGGLDPLGSVYIKGDIIIEGEIDVKEGPAGLLWFYPKWSYGNTNSRFKYEMKTFKFLDEDQFKIAFKVSPKVLKRPCMTAPAKIQISGVRVLIGDTDEAGAYPVNTKILNVGEYKPCIGR